MRSFYDLSFEALKNELKANNIASFRAQQLWNWVYKNLVFDYEQMSNLDHKTKEFMSQNYSLALAKIIKTQQDPEDGTIKILSQLQDNEIIETVLMHHSYGDSVCVTTQIGCRIGCSFCASHLGGFVRNLTCGEIVQQILYFAKLLQAQDKRVSHVVIMGIGEPLDNIDNVLQFIDIINDHQGLNIGARHITLSTSGIVPKFKQVMEYPKQINLAVSLHAPNDKLRSQIMKINNAYPLKTLINAIKTYINTTNRRVSLEYIMLKGVNDSIKEAKELVDLVKGLNIHVNLIPFNSVNEYLYKRSDDDNINDFASILEHNHIPVTIRYSKGQNIDGACGQLRYKYNHDQI